MELEAGRTTNMQCILLFDFFVTCHLYLVLKYSFPTGKTTLYFSSACNFLLQILDHCSIL